MKKQSIKTAQVVPDVKAPEPPELSRFAVIFTDDIARRAIHKQLEPDETEAVIRLYTAVMHSPMPKTCSNCVSDAFFELYNIWKHDPQHFEDLYNCEYRLRGGVLLQVFSDKKSFTTNKNLTNKLAEYHLRINPDKSNLFERLPDDWQQRIN